MTYYWLKSWFSTFVDMPKACFWEVEKYLCLMWEFTQKTWEKSFNWFYRCFYLWLLRFDFFMLAAATALIYYACLEKKHWYFTRYLPILSQNSWCTIAVICCWCALKYTHILTFFDKFYMPLNFTGLLTKRDRIWQFLLSGLFPFDGNSNFCWNTLTLWIFRLNFIDTFSQCAKANSYSS